MHKSERPHERLLVCGFFKVSVNYVQNQVRLPPSLTLVYSASPSCISISRSFLKRLGGILLSCKRGKEARPLLPVDASCRDWSLHSQGGAPLLTAATPARRANRDDCSPHQNRGNRCPSRCDATTHEPSRSARRYLSSGSGKMIIVHFTPAQSFAVVCNLYFCRQLLPTKTFLLLVKMKLLASA